jgi:hypothetical protein
MYGLHVATDGTITEVTVPPAGNPTADGDAAEQTITEFLGVGGIVRIPRGDVVFNHDPEATEVNPVAALLAQLAGGTHHFRPHGPVLILGDWDGDTQVSTDIRFWMKNLPALVANPHRKTE